MAAQEGGSGRGICARARCLYGISHRALTARTLAPPCRLSRGAGGVCVLRRAPDVRVSAGGSACVRHPASLKAVAVRHRRKSSHTAIEHSAAAQEPETDGNAAAAAARERSELLRPSHRGWKRERAAWARTTLRWSPSYQHYRILTDTIISVPSCPIATLGHKNVWEGRARADAPLFSGGRH